jgi:hypothetical protein
MQAIAQSEVNHAVCASERQDWFCPVTAQYAHTFALPASQDNR